MQKTGNSKIGSRAGQSAGALIMLALLLFLGAAAVSVSVHELICSDADQPGHHCAVTQFAAGQIETPLAAVACWTVFLGVLAVPFWSNEAHPASPRFQLSPSRAPPASLA